MEDNVYQMRLYYDGLNEEYIDYYPNKEGKRRKYICRSYVIDCEGPTGNEEEVMVRFGGIVEILRVRFITEGENIGDTIKIESSGMEMDIMIRNKAKYILGETKECVSVDKMKLKYINSGDMRKSICVYIEYLTKIE